MFARARWEADVLAPLCAQAWELRGTGYVHDAVQAIVDAYDRAPLTMYEAERLRDALVARVLRETHAAAEAVLASAKEAA